MTTPTAARTDPAAPSRLLRLLTPREARALAHLAAGEDIEAIAGALAISPGAARAHLHRAMRKLGVRTRAQAVAVATLLPARPATAVPARDPAPLPATLPAPTAAPVPPVARPDLVRELCDTAHTRLVQQTFLLTGRRHCAVHCVRRALGAAARQQHEVSELVDRESWVRAYAFEAALSPWRRGGPRRAHRWHLPRRRIRVRPASASEEQRPERLTRRDRALLRALRRLPRPQRRALVLHDALGLSAARVAVEVESSTAAAEGRVRAARAALARSVPDLVGPDPQAADFGDRLSALLHRAAVHGCPAPRQPVPVLLKTADRLRTGLVTGAAALLTLAMGAAILGTLAGNGPADFLRAPAPAPPPLCSATGTGSAGPAVPGGQPGVRSVWCGVASA